MNFYLHFENVCTECYRADEQLHLGKSSAGWNFSFQGFRHEYETPVGKVENIDQWKHLVQYGPALIKDENGDIWTPDELIKYATDYKNDRKCHAEYMKTHKDGKYFDDEMVDGFSFSFNEFS